MVVPEGQQRHHIGPSCEMDTEARAVPKWLENRTGEDERGEEKGEEEEK